MRSALRGFWREPSRAARWAVTANVIALGFTSLFTDISSEMVSTILPLYLMFYLRLSPLEYGFVDGLYQGASAIVRVFGGYAADRWQRYKEVAGLGYALSERLAVSADLFYAPLTVRRTPASAISLDPMINGRVLVRYRVNK